MKHNTFPEKVTVAKKINMQRNIHSELDSVNRDNRRANALRRLENLRMRRREEVHRSPGRQRSTRIPIPPTPPAREINPSTLNFLFEKRLKYSDIKDEGRIVVPKSYAEKFMPALEAKEGFFIFMDDLIEVKVWRFRYRFWPNNTSRVYVLENTTEFVKGRGLRIGDFMMIYKDNETQRFAIGMRRSTENTTGQAVDQSIHADQSAPQVAMSYSYYSEGLQDLPLGGSSLSSLTADDDENFYENQFSPEVVMNTSSYSGGLQDFPMNLQQSGSSLPTNLWDVDQPFLENLFAPAEEVMSTSSYTAGLQDFPMDSEQSVPSLSTSWDVDQSFIADQSTPAGVVMSYNECVQGFPMHLQQSTGSSLSTSWVVDQTSQANLSAAPTTSTYNEGLPLHFQQSGSSSATSRAIDQQSSHANQSAPGMGMSTSSYSDGLQEFPLHLLDMDGNGIKDLPEF